MMMSVCSQDAKLAYDSCRRRFCPLQHSEGVRESPQFDVGELQISHDLQLVDAAEVLHAVSELEQVGSVHRQLELMGLTQDEDLRGGGGRRRYAPDVHPQPGSAPTSKYSPEEKGKKGSSRSS